MMPRCPSWARFTGRILARANTMTGTSATAAQKERRAVSETADILSLNSTFATAPASPKSADAADMHR